MKRMNRTLIIGILLGFSIVTFGILYEIDGMSPKVFLHPVSILVVIGGTIAASLISMPFKELMRVFSRTYYAIKYPKNDFTSTLREIVRVSVSTNKDVLQLEKEISVIKNAMLREGLNFISMGFKTEDIKRYMEIKKDQNENALAECSISFFSMAKLGPAFGLLGTLIGLIILLYYHMGEGNMEKVASSMGVALTATLYGVGLANLIFAPLGDYMQYNAERCAELDNMIIEGVLQIKERRHPVYLLQALKAYLPREDYHILDEIMKQELASIKQKTSAAAQSDTKKAA